MKHQTPKTRQTFPTIIAFLVLVGIVAAVGFFTVYLLGLLASIEKEVAASIIAASGTVLTAVFTVVYSQNRAKAREIAEAHRPHKTTAYKHFMSFVSNILWRTKKDSAFLQKGEMPEDLQESYFAIRDDLIAWGSPQVIKAYTQMQRQAGNRIIILVVDDILQEMRKDLGLSNKGLQRGDLVKMFLSNPEELDDLLLEESGKHSAVHTQKTHDNLLK